jgi:hypothetical protein
MADDFITWVDKKLHDLSKDCIFWAEARARYLVEQKEDQGIIDPHKSEQEPNRPRRGLLAGGWKREVYELAAHFPKGVIPSRLASAMGYNLKKIRGILADGTKEGYFNRQGNAFFLTGMGTALLQRSVPYAGRPIDKLATSLSPRLEIVTARVTAK